MKQAIISFVFIAIFCFSLGTTAYASEQEIKMDSVEEQMKREHTNYLLQNNITDPNNGFGNPSIQPRWLYVSELNTAVILDKDAGTACSSVIIIPVIELTDYVSSYMQLQKKVGGSWYGVKTWSSVAYISQGDLSNQMEEEVAITTRTSYRTWSNNYIYTLSGKTENVQSYSPEKTY